MPAFRLRLRALSPFAGNIPSGTTLLGATLWGARLLEGPGGFTALREAVERRSLAFSDPFPTREGDPLLPRPLLPLTRSRLEEGTRGLLDGLDPDERDRLLGATLKAFRASGWLSLPDFGEVLRRGRPALVDLCRARLLEPALGNNRKGAHPGLLARLLGGRLVEEPPPLGGVVSVGVALDRLGLSTGGEGTLFFREERGWGLLHPRWTLTVWAWCEDLGLWREIVLPAIRLVCDLGLGADGPVGRGRLALEEVREAEEPWFAPRSPWAVLLSPCAPWPGAVLPRSLYRVESGRPWPHGLLEPAPVQEVHPGDRFFTLATGSVLHLQDPSSPVAGQVLPFRSGGNPGGRVRPLVGLLAFFEPGAEVEG